MKNARESEAYTMDHTQDNLVNIFLEREETSLSPYAFTHKSFRSLFQNFFAPSVSKKSTESIFSHNIKTAVGRGLAPAVQNIKEATLHK